MEPIAAARVALLLSDERTWKTVCIALGTALLILLALVIVIPVSIIIGIMMELNPYGESLLTDTAYLAIQEIKAERSIENDLSAAVVKTINFCMKEDIIATKGGWKRFVTDYFVTSHTVEITVEVPGENPDDPPHTETVKKTVYEFRPYPEILSMLSAPPFSLSELDVSYIQSLIPQGGFEDEPFAPPDELPQGGGIASIVGGNPRLTRGWHDRGISSGIDIGAYKGAPCYAMFDGTVKYYFWKNRWGALSGYGAVAFLYSTDGRYKAVYAHLSQFDTQGSGAVIAGLPTVREYMPYTQEYQYSIQVRKGDMIGRMGDTGFSFGPHLHFGLHVNGTAVDPLNYLG